MTKKIMIDPGHGGHDPGAAANGLKKRSCTNYRKENKSDS